MTRPTIDFGIDLGTTNTSIAVASGTETTIIKNNENSEHTPSAVWLDSHDELRVGLKAKERAESDFENAFIEFKRQMGSQVEYHFLRSDRRFRPEELTAEVLKVLRSNVQQRLNEDLDAAVITVPATFDTPQCQATRRAADLAGLKLSPLLQEPVAAGLAYGFQQAEKNAFWLVYDLGGGTFDAALISTHDGLVEVIHHGGASLLGGKDIDWEIVNQLMIPEVIKRYGLADFRRGNPRWRSAIAKLKKWAEDAKIQVSQSPYARIEEDYLCKDEHGAPIAFEYELARADVARLAQPLIQRSVNICKEVLQAKRLSTANLEKVILVGGPTLAPYLREALMDKREGLGTALEWGVDPLTVVARGAAIFAATQRREVVRTTQFKPHTCQVDLEYKPIGPDVEPLIGGRVATEEIDEFAGWSIEITNEQSRPPWRSGRVPVSADGTFTTRILAEKGRQNTFVIFLYDESGAKQEVNPPSLAYTVGAVFTNPPLTHTIGIALADNRLMPIVKAGTPLPVKNHRGIFKQALPVHKGAKGESVRIPLVEGNHPKADRNPLIYRLEIESTKLSRDLPPGAEVEVRLDIDSSRLITARAYIPLLDEEFAFEVPIDDYRLEEASGKMLEQGFQEQLTALDNMQNKADSNPDPAVDRVLETIRQENIVHELEGAVAAAAIDPDAAQRAWAELRRLMSLIDDAERTARWPNLLREAKSLQVETTEVVDRYGDGNHRLRFKELQQLLRNAAATNRPEILQDQLNELNAFRRQLLWEQDETWIECAAYLEEQRSDMSDQTLADKLFAEAVRAIERGDSERLKTTCRQLIELLPAEERKKARGAYAGTLLG